MFKEINEILPSLKEASEKWVRKIEHSIFEMKNSQQLTSAGFFSELGHLGDLNLKFNYYRASLICYNYQCWVLPWNYILSVLFYYDW